MRKKKSGRRPRAGKVSTPPVLLDERRLTGTLMRRQATLGLSIAMLFLFLVLGLPLANHYWPEVAARPLTGFPLTWLLLGILFYPLTWLLSAVFIRASERVEREEAEMIQRELETRR